MNRKGFTVIEIAIVFVIVIFLFMVMMPPIGEIFKQKRFHRSGFIRQLTVSNATEANFFVFSGSINNEYYYVFYGQNNNEIRLIKLYHGNVSIYEDIELRETPYYKRVSVQYWELHIPKNSITHKMDINLLK